MYTKKPTFFTAESHFAPPFRMHPNTLESARLWVNHRFGNREAGQDAQKKGSDEQAGAPPPGLPAQLALLFWAFCWWPESDGVLQRAFSKEELGQLVSEWLRRGGGHNPGVVEIYMCNFAFECKMCAGGCVPSTGPVSIQRKFPEWKHHEPMSKAFGFYKIKWAGN